MEPEKLFSFAEAAAVLGVPESTLRKKAAAGEVPHRKIFRHTRFSLADLRAVQELRPRRGRDVPDAPVGGSASQEPGG